jgi:hypothetical protein
MSKAYDRVLYNILLKNLYGIGVRGQAYDWFASYLRNRTQYVELDYHDHESGEIRKFQSTTSNISISIPQGSVLGCVLFLIYINDLPNVINSPSTLFADDVSVLIPCNTVADLNIKLEKILQDITNWLTDHNLKINFSKTKLIEFGPYQRRKLPI